MLVDSWTATDIVSTGTSSTLTVPVAIPIGRLVAIAHTTNGVTASPSATDVRSNTWTRIAMTTSGITHTTSLFVSRLTTALQIGDLITFANAATANRRAWAVGVFNDVTSTSPHTASTGSVALDSFYWDTGFTGSTTDTSVVLVLSALGTTANGMPYSVRLGHRVVSVATTAGAANRAAGLFYSYEAATAEGHKHAGGLANNVGFACGVGAFASTAPAPIPGPVITFWDGDFEHSTFTSLWDGDAELPLSEVELAVGYMEAEGALAITTKRVSTATRAPAPGGSLAITTARTATAATVPTSQTTALAVTTSRTAAAIRIPAPLFLGHVWGKTYFGWSTLHTEGSATSSTTAEYQLNNQTPFNAAAGAPSGTDYAALLGIRRLYNKVSGTISHADAERRVLWISAKGDELGASSGVTGWSQIASGSKDANIVSYFNSLVSRNKLTIFTFHHEPIGDSGNPLTGADAYCGAFRRIMTVVNSNFSGHRILFAPNYEENRLRNLQVGGTYIDWARWLPADLVPGGSSNCFDFISFDIYQYNANTSTNSRAGVQFSHRWWRIDELFTGEFTPTGTTAMPWMDYTPGEDITFGIGECASRAGAFYMYENPSFVDEEANGDTVARQPSNMTGAKYARDMFNYISANRNKFAFISWFNSIGAALCYNDERLWPGTNTWGGKTPNHPSLVQQTGDTEYTINMYRQQMTSGLTVKLASTGLPPT